MSDVKLSTFWVVDEGMLSSQRSLGLASTRSLGRASSNPIWEPLSLRHLALDPSAIGIGREGSCGSLVTPLIAQAARRHNVACEVFPPILFCHQVLGGALSAVGLACFRPKLGRRSQPHRKPAVIAAAGLGVEGRSANGFEAFVAHKRAPESKEDSRAS